MEQQVMESEGGSTTLSRGDDLHVESTVERIGSYLATENVVGSFSSSLPSSGPHRLVK